MVLLPVDKLLNVNNGLLLHIIVFFFFVVSVKLGNIQNTMIDLIRNSELVVASSQIADSRLGAVRSDRIYFMRE